MKRNLITIAVFLFFLTIIMCVWEYKIRKYFFKPEKPITIIKESKPVYKYIRVPTNNYEYKTCCESKIEIDTKLEKNIMWITASDNWKQTEKQVVLNNEKKSNWPLRFMVGGTILTVGTIVGGFAVYKIISK